MRYVLARLGQCIFVLIAVSLLTFWLPTLYFSPIGLAVGVIGPGCKTCTKATYVQWAQQHGLLRGFFAQYWSWLTAAIHGNFGLAYKESSQYHPVSVNTVLSGALWRSVWLVVPPTILATIMAIPIGLTQAVRRNKLYDHSMTTIVYILYSTPAVLLCTLMAYYLAIELHIGQPAVSSTAVEVSPGAFPSYVVNNFSQFLLPYLAIIFLSVGGLTRFMRGSALDTMVQDYVRTARAKGASPTRVLFRHVLRPSVIPLITILGLTIPAIIGGALIVEFIFNFPGMGLQTVKSVETGDFTVVMAITLFTAFLVVIGNLAADLFNAAADPRIRLTASR